MFNRRNAMMGWDVWQLAKYMGRKKAQHAAPSEGGKPTKSLIAVALAAVAGASAFGRTRRTPDWLPRVPTRPRPRCPLALPGQPGREGLTHASGEVGHVDYLDSGRGDLGHAE